MITIFTRKEIFVGTSLEQFKKTINILSKNKIRHTIKVIDRNTSSLVRATRSLIGNIERNRELSYLYHVYVHGRDYDKASCLLNNL